MIKEATNKVVNGVNLSYNEASEVMKEIMTGEAGEVNIAAYLTALRMKGETIDEITACANVMREVGEKLTYDGDILEIVGTGGDEAYSFNISTTSAIVVSACGIKVAKHGNRSVSSKSGAADVLEALGVKLDISPEKSKEILDKANVCFMFAQKYHKAMRFVGPVRKELGMRTIFNILGPLANPANANMQLLGVYEKELVRPMAEVLVKLGVKRGMVVYGEDRLDEISVSAPTYCAKISDGEIEEFEITPEQFGLKRYTKAEIVGGTPAENAVIVREILSGKRDDAMTAAVLFNCGAAISFIKDVTIEEGIEEAREAIRSGKALKNLETFIKMSNE